MDKIEKWKPIEGYDRLYEVSSHGRVKSVPRNTGNQFSKGVLKKVHLNKYGYPVTTLVNKDKGKLFTIHRLVAIAFIPNPGNKPQVSHLDGNKQNNIVSNLEWCDAFENQLHRFKSLGHVAPNRLLSKDEVFNILSQKGKGWRKDLSIKLGVSEACIKAVRSGRNYKNWYDEYMDGVINRRTNRVWMGKIN